MQIRIKPSCSISKPVEGAATPGRATIRDMGIDHRRLHVTMAQKFLDGLNLEVVLKRGLERLGEHGDPLFRALPVPDENLVSSAVMAGLQRFTETVKKFRLSDSLPGIAWMAYRCTRNDICGTSFLHGLFSPFRRQ
jgi:hypothetical protein